MNLFRVLIADYKASEISAEIPYLFNKAGCVVDVFCTKSSWLLKNSYYHRHFSATGLDQSEYVNYLLKLVNENKYDWTIMADDTVLRMVNDYPADKEVVEKLIGLVIDIKNRAMVGSKAGLSDLCQKYNILTPLSRVYNSSIKLDDVLKNLPWPIVVKIDRSSGGKGVFMCHSKLEVEKCLVKLKSNQKHLLLFQEYIVGDNVAVEALFKNGKLLAYTYSIVQKTSTGEFSSSIDRKYLEYSSIESELINIGQAFGLNGFCSMTFMKNDDDHKHYLIEADLRPQVWFPLARHVGVDFSLAISNYLTDRNILIRPKLGGSDELIITFFPRSVLFAIKNMEVLELMKWMLNIDGRWRFIPIYDFKLLRSIITGVIKVLVYPWYNKIKVYKNVILKICII